MLLKSTGSLRRKRAENSPVCRTGKRGKRLHECATCTSYGNKHGIKKEEGKKKKDFLTLFPHTPHELHRVVSCPRYCSVSTRTTASPRRWAFTYYIHRNIVAAGFLHGTRLDFGLTCKFVRRSWSHRKKPPQKTLSPSQNSLTKETKKTCV